MEQLRQMGNKAEEGAVAGLATGAVLAKLGAGHPVHVVPGIGPAIFGGTLGAILSSAAAGAAAAGIGGALVGLGIPDDDAKYYEGEFKAGRKIVTVRGGPQAGNARTFETCEPRHCLPASRSLSRLTQRS